MEQLIIEECNCRFCRTSHRPRLAYVRESESKTFNVSGGGIDFMWGFAEQAYDRESDIGQLNEALDQAEQRGWVVIDMKQDWKTTDATTKYIIAPGASIFCTLKRIYSNTSLREHQAC